MKTISDLITELEGLKREHGDVPLVKDGWNDCGIVEMFECELMYIKKTGIDSDGEISRVYEECEKEQGFKAIRVA